MITNHPIQRSALSVSITQPGSNSQTESLPREVIHNLRYQHGWTDLRLNVIEPQVIPPILDITASSTSVSTPKDDRVYLISGIPPRQIYIHPDFQKHLIKNSLEEADVQIQSEWVIPMSTGETWTLKKFCRIFDVLPTRDPLDGSSGFKHQDAKRVLCGMKAHDGAGGDGTIVYYIMQEGEVKPRQN